jgi:hypothetical protein
LEFPGLWGAESPLMAFLPGRAFFASLAFDVDRVSIADPAELLE